MTDTTEKMIGRVIRTVEYNTGNGMPETIDPIQIRFYLCAKRSYPVDTVNQAIAAALERGYLVEHDNRYASAEANTYRTYL